VRTTTQTASMRSRWSMRGYAGSWGTINCDQCLQGPDYDCDCQYENAMEHARLCRLLGVRTTTQTASMRSRWSMRGYAGSWGTINCDQCLQGPDYDSDCEYEIAMEHARLCRLLGVRTTTQTASMRSRWSMRGYAGSWGTINCDQCLQGPDYDSDCEYEIAMEHARLCRLLGVRTTTQTASMRSRWSMRGYAGSWGTINCDQCLQGPDYDSDCEYEIAMEHARLCRLLQDWEMAKMKSRSRHASNATRKHPASRYTSNMHNGGLPRQRYTLANSVVTYDKRGGYYTELA
ncbi:hypothetical protein J6590_062201, partial [Homalodisca vitripennis]